MTFAGFLKTLKCSFIGRRCATCYELKCALYPDGNPFTDSDYRKAIEHFESLKVGTKE
jgi:hypothetical protein